MNRSLITSACRLVAATIAGFTLATLLAACGGGFDGTGTPDVTSMQAEKERAALQRAQAMNADAMGRIKSERATKSSP